MAQCETSKSILGYRVLVPIESKPAASCRSAELATRANTHHSARNFGFISDKHLTLSDQISALSKSCSHIRQLRCIRPYLDFKTASTIATSIVHPKLDYCNSLYFSLPKCQINPCGPRGLSATPRHRGHLEDKFLWPRPQSGVALTSR